MMTAGGRTGDASREERLGAARAVMADVAHHPDDSLKDACVLIVALSDDPGEIGEAAALHLLVEARRRR